MGKLIGIDALEAEYAERIRRTQDTLTRAAQTLAQAAQRGEGGPSSPGGAADGVVDAEFRDVGDRKP